MPDSARIRNVPCFRGVDAVHVAHPFTVLGVLARGKKNLPVGKDGRGDPIVARFRPDRVLRVQVESPEFFAGSRVETIEPTVTTWEKDLRQSVHIAQGG